MKDNALIDVLDEDMKYTTIMNATLVQFYRTFKMWYRNASNIDRKHVFLTDPHDTT